MLKVASYNRYLAVAARVVRRSLKEQPRLQAERRGEMDLRFAKWQVRRVWRKIQYAMANTVSSEWKARREQESCKCKLSGDGGSSRAGAATVVGNIDPKSLNGVIVVVDLYIGLWSSKHVNL